MAVQTGRFTLYNAGTPLRLAYETAETNYADFSISSGGDLTIAPTGGDTNVTGNLDVSGALTVGTDIAYSELDLTGSIVNADISATAEIAVSKLADGAARQVLQTDAAGTGVEWTNSLDLPGTLDVTGAATLDTSLTIAGSTTVNGIIDDDTMATASDTTLATSESIKAYVDTQLTAEDLDFAGDSGTGAVDLDSQSLTIAGTTNEIVTSATGQTLTIGLPSNITVDVTGNADTATKLSSSRTFALTGDVTGSVSSDLTSGASIATSISELPVSKLQDGSARQLLQTDAAGTGVEWTSNVDVPGTLDVTGATTLDSTLTVSGDVSIADKIIHTGDTNTAIRFPSNDAVTVETAGTERLRVTSAGRMLVGRTSDFAGERLSVTGYSVFGSTRQVLIGDDPTTAFVGTLTNHDQTFRTNNTERMRITNGGEVYVAGTTDRGAYNLQCNGTGVWGQGAYVNGSDERMKQNITELYDGLNVIKQMRPVTYQYKPEFSRDQNTQPGFIAQDLQRALEGKEYRDGVVPEGPQYLNVAYQNLIPILVKAIQELEAKVAQLENA